MGGGGEIRRREYLIPAQKMKIRENQRQRCFNKGTSAGETLVAVYRVLYPVIAKVVNPAKTRQGCFVMSTVNKKHCFVHVTMIFVPAIVTRLYLPLPFSLYLFTFTLP